MSKKEHWETIYQTKKLSEVSWYQKEPITAIQYLIELGIGKEAAIIDVGGGDSFLVDYLLENDYQDVSVLDISAKALERAQSRLGADAAKINWIEADAAEFVSDKKYDFWYDRAAFHFLTERKEIISYTDKVRYNVSENGQVVIGTFSEKGPTQCSGIDIKQYSAMELEDVLSVGFRCTSCQQTEHTTPFGTTQHFTFCSFSKL
jgi:ubiquinone/menaquinone biosynthesis C-methylase UbiE